VRSVPKVLAIARRRFRVLIDGNQDRFDVVMRAADSIPMLQVDEERWEGDRLFFCVRALGQTASGHLDVAENHARLEVTLPWLLQRFAKAAQVAIRNRGKLLLTKRN
jgi:hypothetical protein